LLPPPFHASRCRFDRFDCPPSEVARDDIANIFAIFADFRRFDFSPYCFAMLLLRCCMLFLRRSATMSFLQSFRRHAIIVYAFILFVKIRFSPKILFSPPIPRCSSDPVCPPHHLRKTARASVCRVFMPVFSILLSAVHIKFCTSALNMFWHHHAAMMLMRYDTATPRLLFR